MENQIESTGQSVEAALENALAALGARRADVRWDVVEAGSRRVFGLFGRRQARVRVERLAQPPTDTPALVRELLAAMSIPAEVEVARAPDHQSIDIRTEGLDGLLIGKRGETLAALQHVLGRIVAKRTGFTGTVSVDVGGYRQRREAQLVEKARVLADKVKATGREINFEPLHAGDRRIVHDAVANVGGVRTYTVGQGLHRNVVIAPQSRPTSRTP